MPYQYEEKDLVLDFFVWAVSSTNLSYFSTKLSLKYYCRYYTNHLQFIVN